MIYGDMVKKRTMIMMSNQSYLIFKKSVKRKFSYYIYNAKTGDYLGKIYYYIGWHKIIFTPEENTIWDYDCLEEITNFIKSLKVNKDG